MKTKISILRLAALTLLLTLCQTVTVAQPSPKSDATVPGGSLTGMFPHPWKGKKVAYFGDSITDPRNKAASNKYWKLLQEWLGITPYVYAVSGRQWTDIERQANLCKEQHGDSIDAILILMGTNDYNNGVPLGQWYVEKEEEVMYGHGKPKAMTLRKRQYPCMTDSTYRGRMNKALSLLKRMYPTKQIVIMTPLHRQNFHANEKNWQCSEDYTNQCGEYLQAYVDATKEAGNVWAVPVIDLNAVSGLYPMLDEHAQYFNNADTDRLHPNNKGHQRIALTLMYQLLSLPAAF